ncbi:MAG TPA: DUF4157 domain-containing protein [Candidatus Angelobacter sp.]|nr:DUF4157 domain-containing protein [Candidatus Angelobacter sp.]
MSYGTHVRKKTNREAPGKGTGRFPANALRINGPSDTFEQEADRVAREVLAGEVRHGWSPAGLDGMPVQRKCRGGAGSGEECEECKKKNEGQSLQRKAEGPIQDDVAPPIVHDVLNSPGRSLDKATRDYFESRFGHDFSKIRIHSDGRAAESARAVHALAYTVGENIAFAAGRYSPNTAEGRRLLAHELVHAVQQGHSANVSVRAAGAGPQISRSGPQVACTPEPNGPSGGASTPKVRVIRLDNNVIDQVGRGNANVANTLRQLAKDPNVKLEMNRGVYLETTRVTGDMLAARKALIEKLNIKIVDESIAERTATYEKYAKSSDFPTHGRGKITGSEAATIEDLPHIASAAAGGKDVELWSFDARAQTNAERLGVKVAPESRIAINKGVPDSHLNIIRLVPEVVPSDVKGPGSGGDGGGGKGGGGGTPPAAPAAGGSPAPKSPSGGGAGGASAIAQLTPLAEGTQPRPASQAQIIARQKLVAQLEMETAESLRFSTRLQVYGAVLGGLLQIYSAISTVNEAVKFASDGTLFGEAQQNADKLAAKSAQDLDDVTNITNTISLLSAVQSVSDARERGDSDDLFSLSESLGNLGSSLTQSVDEVNDKHNKLEARLKALEVMAKYFETLMKLPLDPMAGTIPQAQAFETYESIQKFMGPLAAASSNYESAATSLNYYANYISGLAHEANKSAWIFILRRVAQAQKAAAARPATTTAPPTPPPAAQKQAPSLLPTPGPQQQAQSFQPLPGASGPSPFREVEEKKSTWAQQAIDLIARGNQILSTSDSGKVPAFKHDEEAWRNAVTAWLKQYGQKGPSTGVTAMDELLNSDQYGGRLKQIRRTLGE